MLSRCLEIWIFLVKQTGQEGKIILVNCLEKKKPVTQKLINVMLFHLYSESIYFGELFRVKFYSAPETNHGHAMSSLFEI